LRLAILHRQQAKATSSGRDFGLLANR